MTHTSAVQIFVLGMETAIVLGAVVWILYELYGEGIDGDE